jgi:antitoxin YefM
MKSISVENDIMPVGAFKIQMAKCLKKVQTSGHPLIITQNGKPAGVLLAPKEYDELIYRKEFLDSVQRGLTDAELGRTYSTQAIISKLVD